MGSTHCRNRYFLNGFDRPFESRKKWAFPRRLGQRVNAHMELVKVSLWNAVEGGRAGFVAIHRQEGGKGRAGAIAAPANELRAEIRSCEQAQPGTRFECQAAVIGAEEADGTT